MIPFFEAPFLMMSVSRYFLGLSIAARALQRRESDGANSFPESKSIQTLFFFDSISVISFVAADSGKHTFSAAFAIFMDPHLSSSARLHLGSTTRFAEAADRHDMAK
jgi:hypothetical protein